ncbi:MAG: FkbM family methyltransferase [Caldilineaceae bacterium]|nr:FkbM family methyltransferase [Caldilineaceae bacterium]MCB9155674.1 FkbM family methyltransferase [Caldilineaceae bacterium]
MVIERLEQAARFILCAEYRKDFFELRKLARYPRYTHGETSLLGSPFQFCDAASFISSYQAIFKRQIYTFSAQTEQPLIIDCGANIGLAVFFWKQHYPQSRIIAFEADPLVFELLEDNCKAYGWENVELVNKAVWSVETTLPFWQERADAGQLVTTDADTQVDKYRNGAIVTVKTVQLSSLLNVHVDLLKLDVEGAEMEVLRECKEKLQNVQHLFVEYHSFVDGGQELDELLSILKAAGFRYHIQPELVAQRPFVQHLENLGMDQRLNIFAYRL